MVFFFLVNIDNATNTNTNTNTTNTSPTTTTTTTTNSTLQPLDNNSSNNILTPNNNKPVVLKDSTEDNWKDVYRNIKCMDQLYDASFYSWLKSEENVLVTAMYLHRIANEYPLVRIINALKWLISDWRLESISTLVRHVTVDWCDEAGNCCPYYL
jgi:squalene cyclase